ncbi:hypothetical protein [Stieleria varia]|uniref:Leucine Rich repeats (2 copies) n=1 Tax=Stieleria varia TaxID=2528005 RepID=A0A5C6AFZ8_9BACT|nr:hypothetical protein [Stieleria varia]TWT98336.1 hypothetical protein Pla52n_48480 [Stieleria varia]
MFFPIGLGEAKGDEGIEILDASFDAGVGELRIKSYGEETKSYLKQITASAKHVPVDTLAFWDLHTHQFFKLVPDFSSVSTLEFRRCELTDLSTLLNRKSIAKTLNRVYFVDSRIEGDLLVSSEHANRLKFLSLSGCELSERAFQSLRKTRVAYFYCAHTDLDATQLTDIAKSQNILEATVQVTQLSTDQLKLFAEMKHLKKLTVVTNQNSEQIHSTLSSLRPDIDLSFRKPLGKTTP